MRNKFVKRMAVAFTVAAMTFTAATSIASASDVDCFTSVKNEMSIYDEEELEETADIDPVYGLN